MDQIDTSCGACNAYCFLIFILISTVLGRTPSERSVMLVPLWSYGEIMSGNISILKEVLLNYILLCPVGIMLPFVFNKRLNWKVGLVIGLIASSVIEVLQLITCRGLFEMDDIIHNSIGCMFGCVICSRIRTMVKKQFS